MSLIQYARGLHLTLASPRSTHERGANWRLADAEPRMRHLKFCARGGYTRPDEVAVAALDRHLPPAAFAIFRRPVPVPSDVLGVCA